MKTRKEINAFNISFLDIMAGALGAVILLFIIVPKVSIQDVEKLEQMEALEVQVQSLDSLLAFLEDAIPAEDYEAMVQKSKEIMATIEELNSEVSRLQSSLKKKTQENENLLSELRASQAEVAELRQQLDNQAKMQEQLAAMKQSLANERSAKNTLQSRVKQLERELRNIPKPPVQKPEPPKAQQPIAAAPKSEPTPSKPQSSRPDMDSAKVVSFNPPMAVMVSWSNPDTRVRLYMKDVSSNQWCFYQAKRRRTPFGKWQNLKRMTNKPHEAIVQDQELVPGTYEVHANILKPKSGASEEIEGYAAINTSRGVKRVDFGKRMVESGKPPMAKSSGNSLLGTLVITEDNITWEANN